jgi:hypothetical protein
MPAIQQFRHLLAVFCVVAALGVPCSVRGDNAGQSPAPLENDGWRRTTSGWEYFQGGQPQFHALPRARAFTFVAPAPAAHTWRLDSHPAALALLQLLATIGAFAFLSPQRKENLSHTASGQEMIPTQAIHETSYAA